VTDTIKHPCVRWLHLYVFDLIVERLNHLPVNTWNQNLYHARGCAIRKNGCNNSVT